MTRMYVAVLFAGVLVAAPVQKTAPKQQAVVSKKTASNAASSSKHVKSARSHSSKRRARRPAAPSYQLHPDPERYAQIQQALSERGYFKGDANGQWGDDSVDALKRFQADQKIENDGKINAHSLTALGLGPKHDGTSASTVPLSATAEGASPAPPPELPAQNTPPQTGPPPPGSEPTELPPQL